MISVLSLVVTILVAFVVGDLVCCLRQIRVTARRVWRVLPSTDRCTPDVAEAI